MPLILSGSGGLSGNVGTTTKDMLPAGSVLQVVQGSVNTTVTNSTSTYAGTGLQATLTPLSASSKILVIISGGGGYASVTNSGGDNKLYRQIASGGFSAVTAQTADWTSPYSSSGTAVINHSFTYLDSPATTSPVTYQPYFRVAPNGAGGGSYSFNVNYFGAYSPIVTITLMEIKG